MSALEEYRKLVTETYPPLHAVETQFVKEYADDAIAELQAENERLKCCGNCHWMHGDFDDCVDDVDGELPGGCSPPDPCHFTPSRWMRRDAS